jgi:hypothetical protein
MEESRASSVCWELVNSILDPIRQDKNRSIYARKIPDGDIVPSNHGFVGLRRLRLYLVKYSIRMDSFRYLSVLFPFFFFSGKQKVPAQLNASMHLDYPKRAQHTEPGKVAQIWLHNEMSSKNSHRKFSRFTGVDLLKGGNAESMPCSVDSFEYISALC